MSFKTDILEKSNFLLFFSILKVFTPRGGSADQRSTAIGVSKHRKIWYAGYAAPLNHKGSPVYYVGIFLLKRPLDAVQT